MRITEKIKRAVHRWKAENHSFEIHLSNFIYSKRKLINHMVYVLRILSKYFLFGFTFVFVEMAILFCFDNTGFVLLCFVTWSANFENSKQKFDACALNMKPALLSGLSNKIAFIWEKVSPVNRDPCSLLPRSRFTGPGFSHINTLLMFGETRE